MVFLSIFIFCRGKIRFNGIPIDNMISFESEEYDRDKEKNKYMKRRTAREKALQILFSLDTEEYDLATTIEHTLDENEHDPFILNMVRGVAENKQEIDERIKGHLEKWSLERVALVERTLLRMAVYELFYLKDAPESVVINEAIEIAHVFGDDKSGKFINGVLSKMIK